MVIWRWYMVTHKSCTLSFYKVFHLSDSFPFKYWSTWSSKKKKKAILFCVSYKALLAVKYNSWMFLASLKVNLQWLKEEKKNWNILQEYFLFNAFSEPKLCYVLKKHLLDESFQGEYFNMFIELLSLLILSLKAISRKKKWCWGQSKCNSICCWIWKYRRITLHEYSEAVKCLMNRALFLYDC